MRGGVRWLYELVHAHARYDLEVDTATISPETCVGAILEWLGAKAPFSAFGSLAAKPE